MRLGIIIPTEQQKAQAGVRIRYERIKPALQVLGHDLDFIPIQNLASTSKLTHDIYLISKCYDARAILGAQQLQRQGAIVGVDLFDDYFSQLTDSRFVRLRYWLRALLPHCSFILCSTPGMQDIAKAYDPHLPIGESDFDVIIDDGSHKSRDIISTFKFFFPRLKPGGLYVAEDLHCSYWSGWQGGLWRKDSAMEFFKSLVDIPNSEHWGVHLPKSFSIDTFKRGPKYKIRLADFADIESITFYNSMCLITKGHGAHGIGTRVVAGQEALVHPALPQHGAAMKVRLQPKNVNKLHLKK